MLVTFPVEIQAHILAHLPRRDLASAVRVSQHLYAVAVRILYEHVELRSLDHIEAFFLPSTILRKGSQAEIKHAESKRAQWEAIKLLALQTSWGDRWGADRSRSLGILPRSLRGRGVERIDLDELYLDTGDDSRAFMPLLRCLNPRKIQLAADYVRDAGLERCLAATGWKDVTHLLLNGGSGQLARSQTSGRASSAVLLTKVRIATLVDRYSALFSPIEPVFRFDVALLIRLCPNLDELKIVTTTSSNFRPKIEELVQSGLAGKPASFFAVELEAEM